MGLSIGVLLLSYIILAGANSSLVLGVIVLDVGVHAGLVSNQTRAFSHDCDLHGGGLGVAISGWLMKYCGWTGVVVFGLALGFTGLAYHWFSAPRGTRSRRAATRALDLGGLVPHRMASCTL